MLRGDLPRLLLGSCLLLLRFLHALQNLIFVAQSGSRYQHVARDKTWLDRRQLDQTLEFFGLDARDVDPLFDRDIHVQVADVMLNPDDLLQSWVTWLQLHLLHHCGPALRVHVG